MTSEMDFRGNDKLKNSRFDSEGIWATAPLKLCEPLLAHGGRHLRDVGIGFLRAGDHVVLHVHIRVLEEIAEVRGQTLEYIALLVEVI